MVQLALILILLAAFRDLEAAVCHKVCTKASKCMRILDANNNLICEDVTEFPQVKCRLQCNGRQTSETFGNDFRDEQLFNEIEHYFDLFKNLWKTKYNFTEKLVWSLINDWAQNMKLFIDLIKDTFVVNNKRRMKRQIANAYANAYGGGAIANADAVAHVQGNPGAFGDGYGGGGGYPDVGGEGGVYYPDVGGAGVVNTAVGANGYGGAYGEVGGGVGGGAHGEAGAGGHIGGTIGGSIGGGIGGGIGPGGIYGGVNGEASGFASGDVGAGIYGNGGLYGYGNAYGSGGLYGGGSMYGMRAAYFPYYG